MTFQGFLTTVFNEYSNPIQQTKTLSGVMFYLHKLHWLKCCNCRKRKSEL